LTIDQLSKDSTHLHSITNVQVSFYTNLDPIYHVDDNPLSVPADFSRYGLSEIINHLLGNGMC